MDELIDVRFEKIFVGSFMKNWNQEQIMTLCSLLLVSIVHSNTAKLVLILKIGGIKNV